MLWLLDIQHSCSSMPSHPLNIREFTKQAAELSRELTLSETYGHPSLSARPPEALVRGRERHRRSYRRASEPAPCDVPRPRPYGFW